jgi:hypothetical protein
MSYTKVKGVMADGYTPRFVQVDSEGRVVGSPTDGSGSRYGKWVTGTIAVDGTSTDEIDLDSDYDFIEVRIPTLVSGTLKLQTSNVTGGTYQDLGLSITTAATTGAYNDVWKLGGYQFIKIVSSGTQTTTARVFHVRGMRF